MTKTAVVSDIHGNLEALNAVLDDIGTKSVDRIFCLGDVIGYGPNPKECLDLCEEFELCLLGNHDNGALFPPEGFSANAERAIEWTRQELLQADDDRRDLRFAFLNRMPRVHMEGTLMFVHGSPRCPLTEYVFPEDVNNSNRIVRLLSFVQHVCFQGHTHIPGVFTEDSRFLSPTDLPEGFGLSDAKLMVNVGSVGQPRDGDNRACYLTLEDNWLEFHRVAYDFEATIAKIYQVPALDNFLGDRLRDGK